MMTDKLEATLRTAALTVFGLLPGLLVSAYLCVGFLVGPQKIVSGEFVFGMYILGVSCLTVFGTYTLSRHLLGAGLDQLRDGMTAGLIAMTLLVLNPLLIVALGEMGVTAVQPRDNLALGAALGTSLVCVAPAIVYAVLSYQCWKLRR